MWLFLILRIIIKAIKKTFRKDLVKTIVKITNKKQSHISKGSTAGIIIIGMGMIVI